MTRHLKRWPRVDPHLPGPAGLENPPKCAWVRVKGSVEYWVAPVKAGRIMFEIDGVPAGLAEEAIQRGAAKLAGAHAFRCTSGRGGRPA